MTTNPAPEELLRRLRQGNHFLLVSHANPDGDAIGSCLGLARVLRALGKGVVVWNRDPLPNLYAPLPGAERIHTGEVPPARFPESIDAVVALECPTLDRTGLEAQLAGSTIYNVDHHLGNQLYGAVNWVEPSAPAAGEMVYRIARGLDVDLDSETATCLYLTLVTDTGGFRFANATPAAFEAAAALVREGARPEQVSAWLHERNPEAMMRLLGDMLCTLELHHAGRISSVVLTSEMFARSGASQGDTEGLIDYPRSIAGVEATALLREKAPGRFKVSLRSRGDIDVEAVARSHGGGGHKNAAGFELEGNPGELRPRVVAELSAVLDRRDQQGGAG